MAYTKDGQNGETQCSGKIFTDNPNFPYSRRMVFCQRHNPLDAVDVIDRCSECYLRAPSRGERIQELIDVNDFAGLLEFVAAKPAANEITQADLERDAARLRGLDAACGVND